MSETQENTSELYDYNGDYNMGTPGVPVAHTWEDIGTWLDNDVWHDDE